MNIRVILAIMRKDVVDAIKNQFILAFLALPLGLALLLRLVFPNSLTDLQQLTVVAYDPGHSRLVATLQEMPNIRILKADSDSQLMESVRVNKAVGGLVVPPDFDASVEARKQPKLTAYLNYRQDEVKRRAFQRLMQQQITALTPPPATIAWVDIDPPWSPRLRLAVFFSRISSWS
ncbi:MAG: ABC transporter permease [Bacillota bacterium]